MTADFTHIVVYTIENHSFDQLLGHFPGADGLHPGLSVPGPQGRVEPFPLRPWSPVQWSPPHNSWDAIHQEWNKGAMNGFVRANGPRTMGYYPPDRFPPFTDLARQSRVLDHYHCAVLGPTLPNRLYLIAGTSGGLKKELWPWSPRTFEMPTIFDQLESIGVSWKYYAGDFCRGPMGKLFNPAILFCPLLWFPRFRRPPLSQRVVPRTQFFDDARRGTLPRVTFLAPGVFHSGHPPLSLATSLNSARVVYDALKDGPQWAHMLLVINFDEAGGYYDHVAPPVVDRFGPGIRVPALLLADGLSPGVIHDTFDHTSVLRLIEEHFNLPLLGERTHIMPSLRGALS